MGRKGEDGASRLAHLEAAAARGNEAAIAALEGPECPEELAYLKGWAYQLCGRSGASMDGLAPLSFPALKSWAELMDLDPTPLEIQALIALDAVIRRPEKDEDEAEPAANKAAPPQAWPEKKRGRNDAAD